jgi:TolB protein
VRTLGFLAAALALVTPSFASTMQLPRGTIAFTRFPLGRSAELWRIDAGGGQAAPLLRYPGSNVEPVWSPDGRRLAFFSTDARARQSIVVSDPSGRRVRVLDRHPTVRGRFLDGHVRWSPDGKRLIFHRLRNGTYSVYVINADGRDLRRLGPGFEPSWSPDRRSIAFALRTSRQTGYDLWTMRPDGTGRSLLRRSGAHDNHPEWSPDGRRIAFESNRNGNTDIYVLDVRNGRERRITRNRGIDVSAVWSPDGNWLAFGRRGGVGFDLWMIDVQTRREIRLTRDAVASETLPSWRSAP